MAQARFEEDDLRAVVNRLAYVNATLERGEFTLPELTFIQTAVQRTNDQFPELAMATGDPVAGEEATVERAAQLFVSVADLMITSEQFDPDSAIVGTLVGYVNKTRANLS